MRLDHATWQEVERCIERVPGIIVPAGSTEQHGPMGMIGTDTICAQEIAERAARHADCLVAPTLAYTPAPFNMAFTGTVSISPAVFAQLFAEIVDSLNAHGFRLIYVLNGHGANLEPLKNVVASHFDTTVQIRSWWDFDTVNALRREYYGDWEGMHATPSEIAITQATHRVILPGDAENPPERLTAGYIARHAGDRHGPPADHRKRFPDGRVGSHSALAHPDHGKRFLEAAAIAVAEDFANSLAKTVTD